MSRTRSRSPRTAQHSTYVPKQDEPIVRESLARIEASFQAALAQIKHSRPFSLDPWSQKLPGASEQRVAGMQGQRTRDHGQSTGLKVGL